MVAVLGAVGAAFHFNLCKTCNFCNFTVNKTVLVKETEGAPKADNPSKSDTPANAVITAIVGSAVKEIANSESDKV